MSKSISDEKSSAFDSVSFAIATAPGARYTVLCGLHL
jgi:hypothetical protein